MTLADYLSAQSLSAAEFARRIGVSTQTVCRYRDGERIPEKDFMERIAVVTRHAVMPNDFYALGRRVVSDEVAA
jgi:transcriptional regulator with XRE-family HTH domain